MLSLSGTFKCLIPQKILGTLLCPCIACALKWKWQARWTWVENGMVRATVIEALKISNENKKATNLLLILNRQNMKSQRIANRKLLGDRDSATSSVGFQVSGSIYYFQINNARGGNGGEKPRNFSITSLFFISSKS